MAELKKKHKIILNLPYFDKDLLTGFDLKALKLKHFKSRFFFISQFLLLIYSKRVSLKSLPFISIFLMKCEQIWVLII